MISADGKFLYATNRASPYGGGENSVVAYSIDPETGALTAIQWQQGGQGKDQGIFFPRHATLVPLPGETMLVVANEKSGTVTLLQRDPISGLLAYLYTCSTGKVTSPSCVVPVVPNKFQDLVVIIQDFAIEPASGESKIVKKKQYAMYMLELLTTKFQQLPKG